LKTGDIVEIYTSNGAGWGNPKLRSKEDLLKDLKNGYLTAERAMSIYGFEI